MLRMRRIGSQSGLKIIKSEIMEATCFEDIPVYQVNY